MLLRCLILLIFIPGCIGNNGKEESNQRDSIAPKQESEALKGQNVTNTGSHRIYSNARFKDVIVERTGGDTFHIKGKAQIFEASFGWVIEDGHDELQKGFDMTDAGAPEWGNFSFVIVARKKNQNSTLHLILFETSAKDGSRQYELPLLLY